MSGDAFHITAPREDGDGAARCMQAALRSAGLSANDIAYVVNKNMQHRNRQAPSCIELCKNVFRYVNAHATSTKIGDAAELQALAHVFGNVEDSRTYPVAVSSTKGHIGHLLGAAGAVEACFTVKAMKEGILLPTLNLEQPSAAPYLRLPQAVEDTGKPLRAVMSNSFGFGGTNCSLVFQPFEPH